LLVIVAAAGGCGGGQGVSAPMQFATQQRMDRGLVVILPGIEGESWMNHDIRDGLDRAGIDRGLPIYRWGRPIPVAGPLINQMDFLGNRAEGAKIARMIVQYQDSHPSAPVYLVGHSGGGGVAVFAAESMPGNRKIEGLVLLSASISSAYDLSKALAHTRNGIVNFYSKADVVFLIAGTTLAGNVDGTRGPAAGAVGFDLPGEGETVRRIHYARLYQVELTSSMTGGDLDAHGSSTRSGFVSKYVAPWVASVDWPPPAALRETAQSPRDLLARSR
jgi:pimeloyl-ACP methyl ester carboxylesterase